MSNNEKNNSINTRVGPARNSARQLLKIAGIKKPPVRINELISILKQEHGLLVKSWLLEGHVSGFLIKENGLTAIAYNETHHVHRQRFTVAHEIGHLVLGHKNTVRHSDISEAEEKEAQIFATELLMPLDFLKADLKNGSFDINFFTERYWVSKQAMSWRVQDQIVLKYIM